MRKRVFVGILFLPFIFMSCLEQSAFGPAYQWDLFKNTPNWELAKAVANEDIDKIHLLCKTHSLDINFQEGKFHKTLLLLAVGNDKSKSTEALLLEGANTNLKDIDSNEAIHEATQFINLKKHSYDIIHVLIKYGANVNSVLERDDPNGKIHRWYTYVPLEGAIEDSSCAKLLLDHGANLYFMVNRDYLIWSDLLILDQPDNDNLYVARYLIVEKKMAVPKAIFYTMPDGEPKDIFALLYDVNVYGNPKKQRAKDDIINYLHQINFPKNGVYIDSSTINKK